ncbi:MAG: M23 family metallopeptidase [Myxococcales bacterium]|nr:M23 family metallopeptidase [Myxococcales bacterium]
MTALALALAITLGGAEVRLAPGSAHPGDPVLITVTGVTAAPSGRLGAEELTFLPFHAGWQALVGLSVEKAAGVLPLDLVVEDSDGRRAFTGSLDVLPPDFRHRQLTVSKRFTSPSKKDRARMAQDNKAFAEAFDRDFEPWLFAGNFAWPRVAELTAPFGDIRTLNGKKKSQHFGLDIDGETGDPVYAANDGEVVLVRECFASGNTVLLHHGGRLFTAYFHLSQFSVKDGEVVTKGKLLGRVGKTGRVTGPHLHWGVKLDGRWVDGESLLGIDFDPPLAPALPAVDGGR